MTCGLVHVCGFVSGSLKVLSPLPTVIEFNRGYDEDDITIDMAIGAMGDDTEACVWFDFLFGTVISLLFVTPRPQIPGLYTLLVCIRILAN